MTLQGLLCFGLLVTVNSEIEQDDSHYTENGHSTYPGMMGDHGLWEMGEGVGGGGGGGEEKEGRSREGREEEERREGGKRDGEGTVVA